VKVIPIDGAVVKPPAASPERVALPPPEPIPLLGGLAVDLAALRRSTDAFFARLADLAPGPGGATAAWVGPWTFVASAAAVEFVRRRRVKAAQAPRGVGPDLVDYIPEGA
jgi:hypothetical protein